MSNAVKCENCGKFEETPGYSVRIYKHVLGKDGRGNLKEVSNRVVTADHLCTECAMKVASDLGKDLETGN